MSFCAITINHVARDQADGEHDDAGEEEVGTRREAAEEVDAHWVSRGLARAGGGARSAFRGHRGKSVSDG
jgi:hypothetical protein